MYYLLYYIFHIHNIYDVIDSCFIYGGSQQICSHLRMIGLDMPLKSNAGLVTEGADFLQWPPLMNSFHMDS